MHTIQLNGPVGDEGFNVRLLDNLPPGLLKIVIDSPGGDIVSGLACYHALREHDGKITVEIIAAGSAAVIPALAGDWRLIRGDGSFFVHGCWGSVTGREIDMRRAAVTFREQNDLYDSVVAERTGLTVRRVRKLTRGETRISASEAVRLGFAHEVIGEPKPCKPNPSQFLERTSLAALAHERRMLKPEAQKLCAESKPIAMCVPGAAALLDRPGEPLPKISPDEHASGEALERFSEAQRRGAAIRFSLELRLRRAIEFGGHVTWPIRSTWTCPSCHQVNYGPPEKNRLATPCAECGAQTSPEETPL